jgi:hypothetical protein
MELRVAGSEAVNWWRGFNSDAALARVRVRPAGLFDPVATFSG